MPRFIVVLFVVLMMGLAIFSQNLEANAKIRSKPYEPLIKPYVPTRLFYTVYMGLNMPRDMDFSERRSGTNGSLRLQNGGTLAGAFGFRFSRQLRVEAELGYAENNFTDANFNGAGTFEFGGELASWTGLLSLYYDAPVDWTIKPFIGAGIGFGVHQGELNDRSGLAFSTDETDTNFIWHVGGGLRYAIGPGVGLSAGYRYLDGQDIEFQGYEIDYGSHEFRIGLDYDLPVKKPNFLR